MITVSIVEYLGACGYGKYCTILKDGQPVKPLSLNDADFDKAMSLCPVGSFVETLEGVDFSCFAS